MSHDSIEVKVRKRGFIIVHNIFLAAPCGGAMFYFHIKSHLIIGGERLLFFLSEEMIRE